MNGMIDTQILTSHLRVLRKVVLLGAIDRDSGRVKDRD